MPFYAPEIAQGIKYSKEVDVWDFGCFAYELATGLPPFAKWMNDESELVRHIISEPHKALPTRWSPSFNDFIDKCLEKDASRRWTME